MDSSSLQTLLPAAFLLLSAALFLLSSTHGHRRNNPSPPGPFTLPIIGHLHLLGPRLHHTFHDLSLRYGPIFQLYLGSIRFFVVSTPELAKEFLKTHELDFSARMNSTAIRIVTDGGGSFSFTPYGSYWKFVKKLCTYELLGARNITHFEPIRTFEVRNFLEAISEKGRKGEAVNVTEELLRLTSNMISNMMLSIRCSDTGGGAAAEARTVVREVTQIFGEFDVSDMFWFCKWFDLQGIRKRSKEIRRRYDALLERIISARERSDGGGGEAKDFLDMLLDVIESGKSEVGFTREHLKGLILVRVND